MSKPTKPMCYSCADVVDSNERAHFTDVPFLERHVRILSDPIFGDTEGVRQTTIGLNPSNKFKLESKSRIKESRFVTTVTQMDSDEDKTTENCPKKQNWFCHCCHVLIL